MDLYQETKKCFHSLLLHRLRSLLSTLGILFGVAAVITMLSIGEGAKRETLEQIEQLGMNSIIVRQHAVPNKEGAQNLEKKSKSLSLQDSEIIRHHLPDLFYISPLRIVEKKFKKKPLHFSPEILAVTRSFGEMKGLQLGEGRFLCDFDQNNQRLVCVLGYDVAKNLGQHGHVGQSIHLDEKDYEIVGVLKSLEWKASKNQSITTRNLDQAIFIPLEGKNLMNLHSSSMHYLSEIALQVRDPQLMDNTVQLIKNILKKSHDGDENYQIIVPKELIQQANRTHHTFNFVLGSIAAISLLVGGIGIMNIMLANVSERTREIGIRRAVGASKHHILIQFLFETLLLTFIGAMLGMITGIGFSASISFFAGWKTIVTSWSILIALAMSGGVGLCSGLYPAYQAANLDPVKALRHN